MRLELLAAEQRRRDVDRQQPLEDRGRLLRALVAVDLSGDDLVGQTERKLDRRELVGEVRLERARERLHERVEVLALLLGERAPDRSVAERLADTEPVPVEVIRVRTERARAAADEPAELDAAADVPQAPLPTLDGAELLPALRRQQPQCDLLVAEPLEDAIRELELFVAARRMLERVFRQCIGRARLLERFRENRLVRCEQLAQHELKVFVVELVRVVPDVPGFDRGRLVLRPLTLARHRCLLSVGPPLPGDTCACASPLRHRAVNG